MKKYFVFLMMLFCLCLTSCCDKPNTNIVIIPTTRNTTNTITTTQTETTTQISTQTVTQTTTVPTTSTTTTTIPYYNSFVLENFNTIFQYPELPTGCEVTSLCEVLVYYGFNIDKVTLADNYLPKYYNNEGNTSDAFIGNPHLESGWGCEAPVIVKTANSYLSSVESNYLATDLTETEFKDVLQNIAFGNPLIVWTTSGLQSPNFQTYWQTQNGKNFTFAQGEHCVVVYGYDISNNIVYVADPLAGNTTLPLDSFESIYNQMGKQVVIIKKGP